MSRARFLYYDLATFLWNSRLPMPGSAHGRSVDMVCLHGVHTSAMLAVAPAPTSSVLDRDFDSNLRVLAKYHEVIALEEAVRMLAGEIPWRPRCVVLTFDDSLKCTVDVALPMLERHKMTATVFVSTQAIDGDDPYWWLRLDYAWHKGHVVDTNVQLPDGRSHRVVAGRRATLSALKSLLWSVPATARNAVVEAIETQFAARLTDPDKQFPYAVHMTWDDVRRAYARGFSIGSHTITHANLAILTDQAACHELEGSKERIERELSESCAYMCYPYGEYTPQVASLTRQCGYRAAVTVREGRNHAGQDPFTLRRFAMPASAGKLAYTLSGCRQGSSRSLS